MGFEMQRVWSAAVGGQLLNVEQFGCLAEALVVIADWQAHLQHAPGALRAGHAHPAAVAADWAHATPA